jgi:programmed cell death 6-interacting protein
MAAEPPPPSAASFLLAVHCKKTEPADLKGPIARYAKSAFAGSQAHDAADDADALQSLRNEAAGLTGSLSELRETLAK